MTRAKHPIRRSPRKGRISSLQAAAGQLRAVRAALPVTAPTLLASTRLPPVTELQRLNTSRLLPARYSDSVLTRIAETESDLSLIYALDSATNERLLAQANGRLGIAARELVSDVPYARIINAAFAHPHPQGARFSTPYRGAWYAGFELATAKAEVLFHRSVQFTEISWPEPEILDYDHYQADFFGVFHDLRLDLDGDFSASPGSDHNKQIFFNQAGRMQPSACLDPASYIASQQLAAELLEAGSLGIVYPSTRRHGGTCLACFRPGAVSNVRKRDLHRLTWYPEAPPTFSRVARHGAGAAGLLLAAHQSSDGKFDMKPEP